MKKPWSISTTLRNPKRLRDFLITLKNLDGNEWNDKTQILFQILLIQNRLYGYGSIQFTNDLPLNHVNVLNDLKQSIPFEIAEEIFKNKKYEDPAMRGRQSINPLKKLGFVSIIDNKIKFNELGNNLIEDQFDLGEVFFRCFVKWQIPNPLSADYKYEDGYDVIPFIATIKLFQILKGKAALIGKEFKGLSKEEFNLFVPTLINYNKIENIADFILTLREDIKNENQQNRTDYAKTRYLKYLSEFLETSDTKIINNNLRNLKDYGDNIIRYFRLTRFFYLRGNGYYIDLEMRRAIEINDLLNFSNGSSIRFTNVEEYNCYLQDINKPELPWLNINRLKNIVASIKDEIEFLISDNNLDYGVKYPEYEESLLGLNKTIEDLRILRKNIQDKIIYHKSQFVEQLRSYIAQLENIHLHPNKALELEKLISYSLYAINDSIQIKPNYPVGDDNEPIFFAPANKPDIECYYVTFNSICEVTMLKSRDQWFNEGQPVMRHFREFENRSSLDNYCIFIAPNLHRDTLNTFWFAVKYEYEGKQQNIIPLTINQFIIILKFLEEIKTQNKKFLHDDFLCLLKQILVCSKSESNVIDWIEKIPNIINVWGNQMIGKNNEN